LGSRARRRDRSRILSPIFRPPNTLTVPPGCPHRRAPANQKHMSHPRSALLGSRVCARGIIPKRPYLPGDRRTSPIGSEVRTHALSRTVQCRPLVAPCILPAGIHAFVPDIPNAQETVCAMGTSRRSSRAGGPLLDIRIPDRFSATEASSSSPQTWLLAYHRCPRAQRTGRVSAHSIGASR
jgi:hypothetical protein